jgi:hypothetical protein
MKRGNITVLTLALVAGSWTPGHAQAADTAAQRASPAVTVYTLVRVGNDTLPARIEKEWRCQEDVTGGTLSLRQDRRWLLETTTREVCGDRIEEDHDTDQGTYTTEGETLRFLDDDGRENNDRGWDVGTDIDIDELKTGTLASDGTLTVKLADGTALVFRR